MTFVDQPTNYTIPRGLNIVCSALSDATIQTPDAETSPTDCDANHSNRIQVVHDTCATHGFLAGWQALLTLYPTVSLNSSLLDDIVKCTEVYKRINPSVPTATTHFRMTISGDPNQLWLDKVPPKVVGGTSWRLNHDYEKIQRDWLSAGFPLMPPSVEFGWPGVQRKVFSRNDLKDGDTMTLLTIVDYDLDRHKAYHSAISHALAVGKRYITEVGTKMQSAALAALFGLDLQVHVRAVQESWVAHGAAGGNLGPDDISPSDWVTTLVGDCGAYGASGYEGEQSYRKSRAGLFAAMVMGNVHDVLYDIISSSRVSSSLYAFAAGVTDFNLHCTFVISMTDQIAHRILALNPTDVPLYGDNALLSTGVWSLFIERYRTWERFIKYMRILRRSNSPKAQNIINMARRQIVLKGCDINDVDDAWRKATTRGSETGLTHRITVIYPVSAAPEMAQIPGHPQPDLCPTCNERFQETLLSFEADNFQGISGLPTSVTTCPAVARAAALRRVAIYASDDACCDYCACRIGRWVDAAAYMVCGALMSNESNTNASEWLLQCYAAWAVSLSPVSVMTVLSGFDLLCDVKCEDGAMGERDVLYNWEAARDITKK